MVIPNILQDEGCCEGVCACRGAYVSYATDFDCIRNPLASLRTFSLSFYRCVQFQLILQLLL